MPPKKRPSAMSSEGKKNKKSRPREKEKRKGPSDEKMFNSKLLSEKFDNTANRTANATDPAIKCIICYDTESDTFTAIGCGHRYHDHCLQIWLNINSICPICQVPVEEDENSPLNIE